MRMVVKENFSRDMLALEVGAAMRALAHGSLSAHARRPRRRPIC
jgi:hypothetical protein